MNKSSVKTKRRRLIKFMNYEFVVEENFKKFHSKLHKNSFVTPEMHFRHSKVRDKQKMRKSCFSCVIDSLHFLELITIFFSVYSSIFYVQIQTFITITNICRIFYTFSSKKVTYINNIFCLFLLVSGKCDTYFQSHFFSRRWLYWAK